MSEDLKKKRRTVHLRDLIIFRRGRRLRWHRHERFLFSAILQNSQRIYNWIMNLNNNQFKQTTKESWRPAQTRKHLDVTSAHVSLLWTLSGNFFNDSCLIINQNHPNWNGKLHYKKYKSYFQILQRANLSTVVAVHQLLILQDINATNTSHLPRFVMKTMKTMKIDQMAMKISFFPTLDSFLLEISFLFQSLRSCLCKGDGCNENYDTAGGPKLSCYQCR